MIIIGYPGVGKSTLADKYDSFDYTTKKGVFPKSVIDLESSAFNMLNDELGFVDINGRPCKSNNWAEVYCRVACELSDQDHLVFVSSHADVQKHLRKYDGPVGIVYPSINLKDKWLERLRMRYMYESLNTKEKDKNFAAYNRACDHYEEDIAALKNNGFELIEITSMDYDLAKLIFEEEAVES